MEVSTRAHRAPEKGRRSMHWNRIAFLVLALGAIPVAAHAQQPTRRRQAPIEIRGQVPTPQVVTVRPRAMPAYSRQVLVPRFFDHDFWPEIQMGYQLVPERQVNGKLIGDTLHTRADSSSMQRSDTTTRRPGTPPAR